jgi:penicillin amidase
MKRRTFTQGLGAAVGTGLLGGIASGRADTLAEIEIQTTEHGESHVYADDLYALSYGNGYVQARDRLFEMDALRHVGYGDSAAIIGPSQLGSDISVRRDLYSEAEMESMYEDASETTRTALEGFADGVNRRIVELAGTGDLPGEFAALGHAPEPWDPVDSIAAISYAIGYFGVSGGGELGNAKTLAHLFEEFDDPAEAYEAYGDLNTLRTPEAHYASIPATDKTVEAGETIPDALEELPERQREFVSAAADAEPWGVQTEVDLPEDLADAVPQARGIMEGFKFGSNAIVVDGEHTETGEPMLGGGPQMGYFKPPVIHEIGLHGAGFDVTGVGVVGAPSVVIGRSDHLAWTVTSGRDDMIDTYAVELDPDDRHRYRWNGEWHEMDTETVVHRASLPGSVVEGDPSVQVVEQEVARVEQNGDTMPVVAWNPDENVAWCQRKTTRYQELSGAFRWAEVGRADTLDEFEDALAEFPFTFNFHVISDRDDEPDISFIHTGEVPDRIGPWDGRLPVPGGEPHWNSTRLAQLEGTVAHGSSRGYFVNWNNGPAVGWRADDAERSWGTTHRVAVLDRFTRQAIETTGGALSLDDVKSVIELAAKHDSAAPQWLEPVVAAGAESDDQLVREMAAELESWLADGCSWRTADGGFGGERYAGGGMAIFEAVRRALSERALGDELGPHRHVAAYDPSGGGGASLGNGPDPHAADHGNAKQDQLLADALHLRTEYDWFRGATSDEGPGRGRGRGRGRGEGRGTRARRRDRVVRAALADARDELVDRFGTVDPSTWQLPRYSSTFSALGATPTEAIPMSNRASYMQAIAAGEGLDGAGDALPPGNSGHVNAAELVAAQAGRGPEHLTDQLELYANYEYKPHPHTREEVAETAVESTTVRATTPSLTGPAEPVRDLPADVLSPLLELQSASQPGDVTDAVSETTGAVTGAAESASEADPGGTADDAGGSILGSGAATDDSAAESGGDGLTDGGLLGGLLDR